MSIKYKGQSITGAPGKDATINGQNTLEIVAGENVTIDQKDGVLTINATASSGGGITENIYSTEEIRIGTWIDGKPIYRRVWQTKTPQKTSGSSVAIPGVVVDSLDSVVDFKAFVRPDGWLLINGLTFNEDNPTTFMINDSNAVTFRSMDTTVLDSPLTIIIEYTKTTDVASVNLMTEVDIPYTMSANDVAFTPATTSISYASVTSSVNESASVDSEKETDV